MKLNSNVNYIFGNIFKIAAHRFCGFVSSGYNPITANTWSSGKILDRWYCMRCRLACVFDSGCTALFVVGCCSHRFGGSADEFDCIFCQLLDESGAEDNLVTFCSIEIMEKNN